MKCEACGAGGGLNRILKGIHVVVCDPCWEDYYPPTPLPDPGYGKRLGKGVCGGCLEMRVLFRNPKPFGGTARCRECLPKKPR